MRLNRTSDCALRLLMFLAKNAGIKSIESVARQLDLPKSQLMKITAALSAAQFIETRRGPRGGIQLKRPAADIRIGEVVRSMEGDFGVVDCLRAGPCDCMFLPRCGLIQVMSGATESFLSHLDGFTLSQVVQQTRQPAFRPA